MQCEVAQNIASHLTTLGSEPKLGLLSVQCFHGGFLWVIWFPSTVQEHAGKQFGYFILSLGMDESLCLWCPVIDWCPELSGLGPGPTRMKQLLKTNE